MTIQIERQVTEKVNVTLDLPAFRKFGESYIKIMGEEHYILIKDYSFSLGIDISRTGIPSIMVSDKATAITEQEYETALQNVSEKIKAQIEDSFVTA